MVQLLVAVLAVAGGAFVVGLGLLRRDRARLEQTRATVWSADARDDRLVTGDAAFDAAVSFVSARPGLEAATRAALIDAVAAGVVHEGGEARVRAQGTLDELVHAVGLAVRACRAVRDDRASPTSLAASDPDPRVRLLALRRARGPEVTRDWLRARQAGAVSVADAAGGALSEPGGDGHLSEPT